MKNDDILETTRRFYQEILTEGKLNLLDQFIAESYTPHHPKLANGIDELFKHLKNANRIPHEIKRILIDDNMALTHLRFTGDTDVGGVDIFKFNKEGKIAEHWLVRQKVPDTVKDDSMFDGGGSPELEFTPEQIESNRQTLHDLYTIFFAQAKYELVDNYYANSYRQHNPKMPDGSERLKQMLKTKGPVVAHVERIICSGDLVAGHSTFLVEGLDNDEYSGVRAHAVDIFRLNNEGKFEEHWDVLEMETDTLPDDTSLF